MLETITESSHKHLDTFKVSFVFKKLLKRYGLLYFTTFSMKSICHTFASFGNTQAKLMIPFSKAFIKVKYFPKFHYYILGPSKVRDCSIFDFFKQILIVTSFEPQQKFSTIKD